MTNDGRNPMRWDCEKDGCFNVKRRPKIEVFCGCFPGRINFGDVDGIVEINGVALMLEWKTSISRDIPTGQRIMYERVTYNEKISVIIVEGNAETMECKRYCLFYGGKKTVWKDACLEDVKKRISEWASYAKTQKGVKHEH